MEQTERKSEPFVVAGWTLKRIRLRPWDRQYWFERTILHEHCNCIVTFDGHDHTSPAHLQVCIRELEDASYGLLRKLTRNLVTFTD